MAIPTSETLEDAEDVTEIHSDNLKLQKMKFDLRTAHLEQLYEE